jgi:hypothetical protein
MSAKRRTLGPGGPSLSQVSYGSMRMAAGPDRPDPAKLLLELHDAGIDTHHSSSEYESYLTYLAALEALTATGRSVQHIVKLAEPGFDDTRFDAPRLVAAVDCRLRELGVEQIAVLQWMCRTPEPTSDPATAVVLHDQRVEIDEAFLYLERSGKVGAVAVFPYTIGFQAIFDHELGVRPACTYLSLFERQHLHLLDGDRPFVALRPFAGASVRVVDSEEASVLESSADRRHRATLEYPLLHPAVATTVVSVNRAHHVATAIDCAVNADADRARFEQITAALNLVQAGVA